MTSLFLFIAVLFLTYSNGANDNFKGVATLWGSGTLSYKNALAIATVATFAGSVYSYFFAEALIKNFSGKGLIPDDVTSSVQFVLSVALAAGLTFFLATNLGFPVSTTHALLGALVGAGIVSFARGLNDTPKFISLIIICNFFSMPVNFIILAASMALGGLLNAKKVANTMSKKNSMLSHSQGFSANFVTGGLVIGG